MVSVVASEIYLTEDQAKSFKESNPPKSPHSTPGTPRRRTVVNRELDLDNIIQGPRGTRQRDKGPAAKGVPNSPSSPKASTSSGVLLLSLTKLCKLYTYIMPTSFNSTISYPSPQPIRFRDPSL